jgi:hypothetical protein
MAVLEPKDEVVGELRGGTTKQTEHKKRFDRNRDELHAIAREFAQKVKDNPYVWGVVAKPYGAYLRLITLVDWQIPKEPEMAIYDAELEIADKYDGQLLIAFDTFDCLSSDRIDEVTYDDPGNIIYRKEEKDAKRENS